jgi:16S rRNA (uracil1498-N3)-methyltransferase
VARRVFVPPDRIAGERAALAPEARHYLRDVLRLAPGDAVEVFDGEGGTYHASIEPGFEGLALGPRRSATAPPAEIWLAFALAKGEKCDLVVQKGTELGAARLLFWAAERSVVRLDAERSGERVRRWRRIAEEASRQCGRSDVPEVAFPGPLEEILRLTPPGFDCLVFHGEGGVSSSALSPSPAGGYLAVIGPEGGLAPGELRACDTVGAVRASLGPRTLRAETAALVAVALLQAKFGDLG